MNLPHKEPLLFAKKIIDKNNDVARLLCEFNELPTIAMFIEAAAQSTIAFSDSVDEKIGFLINAQNVKQINKVEKLEYIIKIKKEIEVNNMKKFSFESFNLNGDLIIATGNITIVIQD